MTDDQGVGGEHFPGKVSRIRGLDENEIGLIREDLFLDFNFGTKRRIDRINQIHTGFCWHFGEISFRPQLEAQP